ncbi:hypothetical protein CUMW_249260 [Citrus unshiu]|uniref:Uncharacterized protein n=1 Tax=Citrus unshiu TaxID=55188 RepID=A0A2H5QPG2_CITUN|nr:hypothetical protein CUMW_249260 [Citrus unshiu]
MVRDVREAGRGSAVPNLMSSGGNDTMSSSHPLIARCRREENLWNPRPHSITDFQISILPSIRPEFRTRQSPFGKGHQISTTAYLNLLKLAEIIFEQSQTERDLRDGGRLPTSRDSSVAGNSFFENIHVRDRHLSISNFSRRDEVYLLLLLLLWMPSSTVKVLILLHLWMSNLLRLSGSWTSAIYVNEWQCQIVNISRDELVPHIHASGNDFSASHFLISIFFNMEGRATSGKETRELQL